MLSDLNIFLSREIFVAIINITVIKAELLSHVLRVREVERSNPRPTKFYTVLLMVC